MSDPFVGQTIGRFQIVEKIGQGGMGEVYRGRQTSLNRSVAIKILPRQMAMDEEFVRRFRQEAEVIAGLAHENMVYVYDIDQHEGCWYIVMEYIDGTTLRQLRGDRPMEAEQVRAIGIPVARALEHAHQRGIIHRDVKSSNVMVTADGKVKLMDFGIAKSAAGGVKTVTGSVLGTPEYMAPEQARTGRVTPQSDVYSLGVLLYELATGRLPFHAEDPFAIALKHISEEPVPPRHHVPAVPPWLESVILKAMTKDPAARYASAAELEHDLLVGGEGIAEAPTLPIPGGRPGATLRLPSTGSLPRVVVPPPPPPANPPPAPAGGWTPPPPTPSTGGWAQPPATPAGGWATPPTPAAGWGQPPPTPPGWGAPPPLGPPGSGAYGPAFAAVPAPAPAPAAGNRPLLLVAVAAGVLVVAVAAFLLLRKPEPPPEPVTVATSPIVGGGERLDTGTPPPPPSLGLDEARKRQLATDLQLDEAEALLAAGDVDRARRIAELVLADDPGNARALAILARADEARTGGRRLPPVEEVVEGEEDGTEIVATTPYPQPPPSGTIERPYQPPGGPAVGELWSQAEGFKRNEAFHSLRDVLDQILAVDPGHDAARDWRGSVDGWIGAQTRDLTDELKDDLEELADCIDDRDLDDALDGWAESSGRARSYLDGLFRESSSLKTKLELGSVEVHDAVASFRVSYTIDAKKRGQEPRRIAGVWNGRYKKQGFVGAFP